MLQRNRPTSAFLTAAPVVLAIGALSFAAPQDSKPTDHTAHQENERAGKPAPSLHTQVAELRAKVARLEAALELGHQAPTTLSAATSTHDKGMQMGKDKMKGMSSMGGGMGMSGMGMSGKGKMGGDQMGGSKSGMRMGMGMGGMKRMRMMGSMGGEAAEQPVAQPSFLPGFPGASHIYHIGATSHFLDHSELIAPSSEQRRTLAEMLEQSALAQSSFDRRIAQAEQELWVLTSTGAPDAASIESKVKEVAALQVEQRLAFIQSVGAAASVLTEQQRNALVGDLGATFGASPPRRRRRRRPRPLGSVRSLPSRHAFIRPPPLGEYVPRTRPSRCGLRAVNS